MTYAKVNHQQFDFDNGFVARAWRERTRYGFRHLATLHHGGAEIAKARVSYYNRTWERYCYESVLRELVAQAKRHRAIDEAQADDLRKQIEDYKAGNPFKAQAALMALAQVMGGDAEQREAMRKRALATIPGIDFPDDFDQLPIEERTRRLDKVEAVLNKEDA